MDDLKLTPEQERVAAELTTKFEAAYREEARRVARLFASKPDSQLLGKTEFELRDRLLHLGAVTIEAALAERKRGVRRGQHELSEVRPAVLSRFVRASLNGLGMLGRFREAMLQRRAFWVRRNGDRDTGRFAMSRTKRHTSTGC